MKKIFYSSVLSVLIACNPKEPKTPETPDANAPKSMSYSIIDTFPHDTSSFTEGLLIYKDKMYESTGEEQKSKLIEADLTTGKIIKPTR